MGRTIAQPRKFGWSGSKKDNPALCEVDTALEGGLDGLWRSVNREVGVFEVTPEPTRLSLSPARRGRGPFDR